VTFFKKIDKDKFIQRGEELQKQAEQTIASLEMELTQKNSLIQELKEKLESQSTVFTEELRVLHCSPNYISIQEYNI
jgi:rRNA maturation endonuclease Nob1